MVNLEQENNIQLIFSRLGPAFILRSPSILCKEFGNAIAFMLGEDVVGLEFFQEDDDLNNPFSKNLIGKSKEEQMQFIYNYCGKEIERKNDSVN